MFIVQGKKKPRRKELHRLLLFLRRNGESEDHCRLSYINSRYQALLLYVYSRPGQFSSCGGLSTWYVPIMYIFTIRPDTT